MGRGINKIKIEMSGTGGGRWMHRAAAKQTANKARRRMSKIIKRVAEEDRELLCRLARKEQ